MVYKVIDTQEKRNMTKRQEEAVTEAFERFKPERQSVRSPKRFGLGGKFVDGYSCKHDWFTSPKTDESIKFFQAKFDETDVGDEQKRCLKCNAYSLWESGQLWAYDAITIDEEKQEAPKQSRKGRR